MLNFSFTEEFILNTAHLPEWMHNWRRFRIEYEMEGSAPEGIIYLPPWVDPYVIEDYLHSQIQGKSYNC